MTYLEFLQSKIDIAAETGFDISLDDINPVLFGHDKDAVKWAIKGGRRGLFEAFGLHKTTQQLEICRIITDHEGGKALIVLPLGVKQEFTHDAITILGWTDPPQYVRTMEEVRKASGNILMTNYERVRDGDIDPKYFTVTTLDEAAVLRSFGSKTYQTFLDKFKCVPYKFVCTATPSPNRFKELIHYAGYLEIMDTGQSLTRFFQRDSTKANNLTLYPHKETEFWLWVSSWALFITKPSDLGYSDDGYVMPPLDIRYHEIPVNHLTAGADRNGQTKLFRDAAAGLTDAAKEKRDSIDSRLAKMVEIINEDPDDHFILWHDLEAERHAIKKAIPEAVEIYGTQDLDIREQRTLDFADGKFKLLATKKELSGSGCNFQRHCHREIFLGIDYKFNDFIQAIHRVLRFLQTERVRIDVIYTESERAILDAMLEKWKQHDYMVEQVTNIVKQYGLSNTSMMEKLARSIGVERVKTEGQYFTAVNNDCILETEQMPDNSVDLIHTSIPFCYDSQTEVLTRRGWVGFNELKVNEDEVATVGTAGCIEYQRPSHVVWERYEGEMIEFSGRSFNLLVTPNHRMYVARRGVNFGPDRFEIISADQITAEYENARRTVSGSERISRGWRTCLVPPIRGDGERPERIFIPALPNHIRNGHGVQLYWIETEDFMRLAGWYLSEGHADLFDVGRSGGRLSIGQSPIVNPENYREIEELFVRIGLPPSFGKNQISVWCRNLAYFMQVEFGHGAVNKRIPRWVLEFHPDLLTILRDTMMKGDGSDVDKSYASISPELRDAFQEICLKTGWRAELSGGKFVYVGSSRPYPEIRKIPKRVHYSGMIGCATVPNGTMIVRRDGQACISGNSNHYEYTHSYNDLGHNTNTERFFEQMDYLTPQLLRILKPGRVYACHVKDRVLFGNVTGTGMSTMEPFHALCIQHYMKHGFQYFGMITVVTDVVRENNQTYRLGWSEQCKDGSKMGNGCPEYILLFRKLPSDTSTAYADVPVTKTKEEYTRAQWQIDAHGFYRSSGDRLLSKDELAAVPVKNLQSVYRKYSRESIYDYQEHVELAKKLDESGKLPASFMVVAPGSWYDDVWDDINRMKTLNTQQSQKRLQLHVCPLQQDIIERIINRYSNPGEVVFDPFAGLFSVPYTAIKMGRKGSGIELNADYFRDGVGYCRAAEEQLNVPTLFDFLDEGSEVI